MIRLTFYIVLAIIIALGAAWVSSHPGEVFINWQGWEVRFSVAVAVLLFTLYTGILLGLLWLLKSLNVFAYFSSPERQAAKRAKAEEDLDQAWSSYALGDYDDAVKFGLRAKGKLGNDHNVMRLLASATQKQGEDKNPYLDTLKASSLSAAWVKKQELDALLQAKSWAATKQLTMELLQNHPKNAKLLELDFLTSAHQGKWQEAKNALSNAAKAKGVIDAKRLKRYYAVIDYCLALEAKAAGQKNESHELIKAALKNDPSFSAAALASARSYVEQDNKKAAEKVVQNIWKHAPTTEIGELYSELYPTESASETYRRIKKLTEASSSPESLHLLAEAAIHSEKWPEARQALNTLLNNETASKKTYHLLALMERAQKKDMEVSEKLLVKAEKASPDAHWICASCNVGSAHYVPLCPKCGDFDSIDWSQI